MTRNAHPVGVISVLYLYSSAQAAITNDHRLGGLNNKDLYLIGLEAGKSKIKVLAGSVHSEDSSWFCR